MKKAKQPTRAKQPKSKFVAQRLIVGLGNPGPQYERTRHNAGFLVIDELAHRHSGAFQKDKHALRAEVHLGRPVILLKPTTFMNLSGQAVQAELTKKRLKKEQIIIVHDDLDLPLGKIRFKHGGSSGGQRGITDISRAIGPDYDRLKIGIGRPPERWTVQNWVLSRFQINESGIVENVVKAAADALETYLNDGLEAAMNAYNGIDLAS